MLAGHRQSGLGGDAQHGGHRIGQRRGVTDGGQLDQPHPVGELPGQLGCDLERQAGLADPAHSGQGDETMGADQFAQDLHRVVTTDEARRLDRQVAGHRVEGAQRRELGSRPSAGPGTDASPRQIAETMRPQIDQVDVVHQRRRRRRDQDLAAVTGRHHPRRSVQHRAEIVIARTVSLAGGDTHAHRQTQPPLRLHGGVDRGPSRPEAAHTPSPVCLNNQPP